MSPTVSLLNSKKYTISYYSSTSYAVTVTKMNTSESITTTSSSTGETYNGLNRYKATFTSFEDSESYSNISVVFSTSSGNITIFHPQIEEGESATAFDVGSNEQTSQIKQTADQIKLAVGNTGVDITNGKILAKTNKFEIVNSNDVTTFSVDSTGSLQSANGASFKGSVQASAFEIYKNGNRTFYADSDGNLQTEGEASFGGTIKAKNLYQGVFMSPIDVDQNDSVWYCNDTATFGNDSFGTINAGEDFESNFTEGKYYTSDEIADLSDNILVLNPSTGQQAIEDSGFTQSTGSANIIYALPKYTSGSYSYDDICLPRPEDFQNKVIDVHPSFAETNLNLRVGCVYSYSTVTPQRMVESIYITTDNVMHAVPSPGSPKDFITIDSNRASRFVSMPVYVSGSYVWCWVVMKFYIPMSS